MIRAPPRAKGLAAASSLQAPASTSHGHHCPHPPPLPSLLALQASSLLTRWRALPPPSLALSRASLSAVTRRVGVCPSGCSLVTLSIAPFGAPGWRAGVIAESTSCRRTACARVCPLPGSRRAPCFGEQKLGGGAASARHHSRRRRHGRGLSRGFQQGLQPASPRLCFAFCCAACCRGTGLDLRSPRLLCFTRPCHSFSMLWCLPLPSRTLLPFALLFAILSCAVPLVVDVASTCVP